MSQPQNTHLLWPYSLEAVAPASLDSASTPFYPRLWPVISALYMVSVGPSCFSSVLDLAVWTQNPPSHSCPRHTGKQKKEDLCDCSWFLVILGPVIFQNAENGTELIQYGNRDENVILKCLSEGCKIFFFFHQKKCSVDTSDKLRRLTVVSHCTFCTDTRLKFPDVWVLLTAEPFIFWKQTESSQIQNPPLLCVKLPWWISDT